MKLVLKLDPELENSFLRRFLDLVVYAAGISWMILMWIVLPARPYVPDPSRGLIVPISNHGSLLYVTKLESFLIPFLGWGGVAWFVGSFALLSFLQKKRSQARKQSAQSRIPSDE